MTELSLLDVCLPDYFQGYDGMVYAVPVDGTTTANELKELLYEEWNSTFSDMDIITEEFKKMKMMVKACMLTLGFNETNKYELTKFWDGISHPLRVYLGRTNFLTFMVSALTCTISRCRVSPGASSKTVLSSGLSSQLRTLYSL